mgnify:CR=1 FL=1
MSHIATLAAIGLELDAARAGRGETSPVVQSLRAALTERLLHAQAYLSRSGQTA